MTFNEALSAVFNDGDRITRATWNNREIYCELTEDKLCISYDSSRNVAVKDTMHPWTITEQDFFADDWEVLADG